MRRAVLLGNPGTKRTLYLQRAAEGVGLPLLTMDWKDWKTGIPQDDIFLKIDPILWESCSLEELHRLAGAYVEYLRELSHMGREQNITFFNEPDVIELLLDKKVCKDRLLRAELPVTELLTGGGKHFASAGELLAQMEEQRIHQVFIKPVRGSGAAGVSPLLERILPLNCIVEKWYAKAMYQGFSYDIRAVVQDKQVDFLLARLSQGPITNLHLNNRPLKVSQLGLPLSVLDSIAELCEKSMEYFPGLRSAGIDILLEKGSLAPRIIEMNAQGDLIYQDIYHENKIYCHQAEIMREWLKGV